MSVAKEIRLAVEIYHRDGGAFGELAAACADAPKGYVIQGVQIDSLNGIRPYDPRRGVYVCTVTAMLVPWRDRQTGTVGGIAVEMTTAEAIDGALQAAGYADGEITARPPEVWQESVRQASGAYASAIWRHMSGEGQREEVKAAEENLRQTIGRHIDQRLRGMSEQHTERPMQEVASERPSQDQTESDANLAARVAHAEGAPRANLSSFGCSLPVFVGGEGIKTRGYGIPSAADDAKARTAKLRAFHVEQISTALMRQDEAAGASGIQPFANRMAFGDHIGRMANAIRTMLPRPGGAEATEYREMLIGLAANCVRELDRLSTRPSVV